MFPKSAEVYSKSDNKIIRCSMICDRFLSNITTIDTDSCNKRNQIFFSKLNF